MARILVIDDDDALRQTMGKILARMGHEVVDAPEGEAGLALFRSDRFDLVVTDLIMPEKEGIETILELREASPAVPILVVSGGLSIDRSGPLQDAVALGADASLPKPFSVQEFSEVVTRLLAG